MICELPAVIILTMTLSAPGYETKVVESCFEEMDDCRSYERIVLQRFREASDKVEYRTGCSKKVRKR